MVVVCVIDRVLCSSRCLCFDCDPMVFRCVPSRFLSCLCFVCVANPAYWYVFLACLVKYVGECHVCVMYVCRWLYCS